MTHCVPPLQPLARRELRFAHALATTTQPTVRDALPELGLTKDSARAYIKLIARKLPGDLPALAKIKVWARGGSLHVLGAPDAPSEAQ